MTRSRHAHRSHRDERGARPGCERARGHHRSPRDRRTATAAVSGATRAAYHQSSGTPAMRMAVGEPGSTIAGRGSKRRTTSTISAIRRPRSAAIGSPIIARRRGRIGMLDDGISR